jgi:hypothetical protein
MENPNVINDIAVSIDGKPNVIDHIAVAIAGKLNGPD